MSKGLSKRGVSLISVLLLMVIISLAIALIGFLTVNSIQVSENLQVYKTTRDAAESVAYSIIDEIENYGAPETDNCTVGCNNSTSSACPIELPSNIVQTLKASNLSYQAYLLRNCTDTYGNTIYTVKVVVSKNNGTETNIIFIYEK